MNGKIMKIFILVVTVFFCSICFFSCSDLDYKEGGERERGDDSRGGRDRVPFDIKGHEPDFYDEDCTEYKSTVKSFRPLTDLFSVLLTGSSKNNPLRQAEACVLKSIDESLKPLCEEEALLKAELKEYENDREIVEEIEKDLRNVQDAKYLYADILYDFAENVDEWIDEYVVLEDPDNGWEKLGNSLLTREARSVSDIIVISANRVCGSTLRRQRQTRK